jgi:hypothetical protein
MEVPSSFKYDKNIESSVLKWLRRYRLNSRITWKTELFQAILEKQRADLLQPFKLKKECNENYFPQIFLKSFCYLFLNWIEYVFISQKQNFIDNVNILLTFLPGCNIRCNVKLYSQQSTSFNKLFQFLKITYSRGSQTFLYGDPFKTFSNLCDPRMLQTTINSGRSGTVLTFFPGLNLK